MFTRLPLMTKILAVASLVVVAAFSGFSLYIDSLQRDSAAATVKAEVASSGMQAAQSISNWLGARVMLTELAANAAAKAPDASGLTSAFDNPVLLREFMSTYMGDEQGVFTTVPAQSLPEGYDPRKRPWYQDALKADKMVLTDPYSDASTGNLIISAAMPVKRDGKLAGVTASDFSLVSLVEMVKSVDMGGKGSAFLVKQDGTILVHRDGNLVTKTLKDVYPENTPTLDNSISESSFAGTDMLVSFLPIKGLPRSDWYLGVQIDRDIAYSGVSDFRIAAAIATIVGVVLMIATLALLLSRVVVRPVGEMTVAMEKLAGGDTAVDVPHLIRADEIGAMARAVQVFKDNAVKTRELEQEAAHQRKQSEEERRRAAEQERIRAEAMAQATSGLADGLKQLSAGNLTFQLSQSFAEEFESLREDFNRAVVQLKETMTSVAESTSSIDSGSREISQSAEDLSKRTEQQAASL
ncbi:PDC sensor domain-containing protein, partial [Rhizobium halophilum]|uniref:PDC sensor domain-containing protein n=1 Tax=Rhizobium halophilum TaxID=2846852 RepID=UPI001EFE4D81